MLLGCRRYRRDHSIFGKSAISLFSFASKFSVFLPPLRTSSGYESEHGIVRGAAASVKTAMMFGEFYPNPTAGPAARVSMLSATGAEALRTFLLVIMIFALTKGATWAGRRTIFRPCS